MPLPKRHTDGKKLVARRVTESYLGRFHTPKRDDGPRHAAIAKIGTFEICLVEIPSVNESEEMSLWVELYDRDLQLGVDSRKCSDFDEAVDTAHFMIAQARLLTARPGKRDGPSQQIVGRNPQD